MRIFLLGLMFLAACGVKTSPIPMIQTKNELLESALRVDDGSRVAPSAVPTPTPKIRKSR